MLKRIVGSTVGLTAVVAGLIAVAFAIEGIEDFRNPGVPFRLFAVSELVVCSMAFAALGIGIRLLRFGWSGRSTESSSRVRPILLGIGCFFPGFVFSMPLALLWARHTWPGDGQSYLAAMEVSCYVGVGATIICSILLAKKHYVRHTL
jgi:uncharacterized membrane protein YidH (DUF202 family)